MAPALHDDFSTSDHRALGFDGADKAEFLRRLAEIPATHSVPISTEIYARTDTVMLSAGALLDGRAGALSLGATGYSVGRSLDGLVASNDGYDTLEEAMARFEELTADS